jgi:putative flippase GtrA
MRQKVKTVSIWLWGERVRISKYLISGFSAFGIDWVVYFLATRAFGFDEFISNVFSVLSGATCAFLANKFWSFSNRENTARQTKRFAALFVFNYLFQQVGFYIAIHYIGLHDLLAKVILVGMMVSWNYLIYKYWIYAMEV